MFFAAKCNAEPENMFFFYTWSFFLKKTIQNLRLKRGGQEILDSMQQRIVWYSIACEGGREAFWPKSGFWEQGLMLGSLTRTLETSRLVKWYNLAR